MQKSNNKPQTIKAKFGEEMRRISFTAENFEQLNKQLAQLFSIPLGSFSINYQDNENDMITLSSDIDFSEASKSSEKVLRIKMIAENKNKNGTCYIEKTKKCHQKNKQPNFIQQFAPILKNSFENIFSENLINEFGVLKNEKKVHDAICDRCEIQIEGIRYKSLDCNDFDLCDDCYEISAGKEDIGNHLKEYQFGKIVEPQDKHLFYLQVQRYEKERGDKRRASLFEKKKKQLEEEKKQLLQKKKQIERRKQQEMQKILQQTQSMESKRSDWTFPQKKIVYAFEDKLALLKKMGFTDRQQNIKVILENKEDFMRSVQQLLN